MLNILQNSVLAKVLGLVLLTALLCIPLARIGVLIEERGQSQRETADELATTHAGPQTDWYGLSAQPGLSGKVSAATAPPSGALPSSMRP